MRAGVMLWWLADELEQRSEASRNLVNGCDTRLDGRWTKAQAQRVREAVQGAGNLAKQLMEAFAVGFGAGTGGGG